MSLSSYLAYVGLAALVTLAPGPDFAVVMKNSLAAGRVRGLAASIGITLSNIVQGTIAAFGLGLLLVRSATLFSVIRWLGVAYLLYLGIQALRAAWSSTDDGDANSEGDGDQQSISNWRSLLQGFLSNITNPKVLVFYLSVLPQFIGGTRGAGTLLLLAYTHAALALGWLLVLVAIMHVARRTLMRPRPRRALEGAAGVAMVGFAIGLAIENF